MVGLRGTSYIITSSTAKKIGLKTVGTDSMQVIILAFNYVNLTVANSFAKGKLSFPKFSRVKTFEGKLADVAAKKEFLARLEQKLAGS